MKLMQPLPVFGLCPEMDFDLHRDQKVCINFIQPLIFELHYLQGIHTLTLS